MRFKAVFDAIIIRPLPEEETTYGSIIVPDMGKEKHIVGDIISIGPGRRSPMSGDLIPMTLEMGQRVVIPRVGVTLLEGFDEEFYACDEGKVLAIIDKQDE